jgi:hypothetical protein
LLIISDVTGKQKFITVINDNENSQIVETSSIAPGIYYVQLMDGSSLLKSLPLVIVR